MRSIWLAESSIFPLRVPSSVRQSSESIRAILQQVEGAAETSPDSQDLIELRRILLDRIDALEQVKQLTQAAD